MEGDQEMKHMCKFCYKIFPCGRSLGGHMRSHLINISSSSVHQKTDQKLPKKKLPPLTSAKNNPRTDVLVQGGDQFGNGHPKKAKKFSKKSEEDTLLEEKLCKECGKTFQSWKALFGHMKCHSVNGRTTNSLNDDSWNSSSDHQKPVMDNQSDNEAATPLRRRKRSDRMKRYTTTTNSSSLTIANFSPCVSEIDHQAEEEVALSLVLLSMDTSNLGGCINSVVESSGTSSDFLQAKKTAKTSDSERVKFKKLTAKSEFRTPHVPRKRLKTSESTVSANEIRASHIVGSKNLGIGFNESEVDSPKNLTEKNGLKQFGSDCKKKNWSNTKCIGAHDSKSNAPVDYKIAYDRSDSEFCQDIQQKNKFRCVICRKAFPSYQALGGHRASHKKFNGCCAPAAENSLETENSPNQSEDPVGVFEEKIDMGMGCKKNKDHECPICFKVFASGQALGGHKRSHLIGDQSKSSDPSVGTQKRIPEIRDFLDLNLPAPVEDECSDFKPWWMGTSHKHQHEPLLGLLSS